MRCVLLTSSDELTSIGPADELLRAPEYFKACATKQQLPRDYQLFAKWFCSQTAHQLYGTFVSGDESHSNLGRAKTFLKMLPWQTLASALRSPAFAMIKQVQARFLQRRFVQGLLELFLQDDPASIQEQLKVVRDRIKSNTAEKKIRNFVEAPDAFKVMVRKSAYELNIPLVVAIVRGSDSPRLNQ